MPTGCHCLCHHASRGDQREASHAGKFMTAFEHAQKASLWEYRFGYVDASDALEAGVACAACLRLHSPALSGPPPAVRPQSYRQQADGYTDSFDDGKGTQ